MSNNLAQVLALHTTRNGGERLRHLVAGAPLARLEGMLGSVEEFERKAVQTQPEILLVELAGQPNGVGDMLERLRRSAPRSAVVAWSTDRDADLIMTAMRLGVREFLAEPAAGQDFNDAVLRLARQAAAGAQPAGRLWAVMGVKGGVGASVLALNLAWALSQVMGQRVALADLDLAGGDLGALLNLEPERGLADVVVNFDRLDSLLMDTLLTEAAPGLRLLAPPPDPVAAEEVRAAHVGRALDHLLDSHPLVLADLACRLDEAVLTALDKADRVILVTEPTVLGLRAARRALGIINRLGHSQEKVELVVNRDGSKGGVERGEVARILGIKPLASLPNDSRTVMEAANAGCPAVRDWPKSKWSKAVTALARALLDSGGDA